MSKNDQLPVVTHNQKAGKSAGPSYTSETRFNALKQGLGSEGICEVDDLGSYKALCRQLKKKPFVTQLGHDSVTVAEPAQVPAVN